MQNYEEVFWICPHCKVHIPLIGDKEKIKRKIDLHPLGCPSRKLAAMLRLQCPIYYKPKTPIRRWLERIKRDFGQNYC